jgi:hypothetical protein
MAQQPPTCGRKRDGRGDWKPPPGQPSQSAMNRQFINASWGPSAPALETLRVVRDPGEKAADFLTNESLRYAAFTGRGP